MKRLTCPICRFSGFTGGKMNFHKCGRNGSFFCGNNSTLWISPPFGRLFSRFDFHIVRNEATHGGKLCGVRAADGWSKIEKILGRRTIPGSFFSGHRPLCDTQARTRSLQSEPQSSPLVILSLVDKKDAPSKPLRCKGFKRFSPLGGKFYRKKSPTGQEPIMLPPCRTLFTNSI
jgi:hypothetical protein